MNNQSRPDLTERPWRWFHTTSPCRPPRRKPPYISDEGGRWLWVWLSSGGYRSWVNDKGPHCSWVTWNDVERKKMGYIYVHIWLWNEWLRWVKCDHFARWGFVLKPHRYRWLISTYKSSWITWINGGWINLPMCLTYNSPIFGGHEHPENPAA